MTGMSRAYHCDQCGEPVEDFIAVQYPVLVDDVDDDGWPDTEEAHLCGYECLAAWAMDAAIESDQEGR